MNDTDGTPYKYYVKERYTGNNAALYERVYGLNECRPGESGVTNTLASVPLSVNKDWADKNGEGEIWPGVTMRRGSRGATVKSAQQKLKTLVPELTTDGRYGASTREAVLAWQVVHDLKPDGMLGRATWNSLYGVTTRKA